MNNCQFWDSALISLLLTPVILPWQYPALCLIIIYNPHVKLLRIFLKLKYILWIIKKAREFQKNIYFCLIDYAKAFYYVNHNKLWKILKEMGIPDHLTCLLRNLYAGEEATVRTGHGTTDCF